MNEHPAMPSRDVDLRDTALSNEHPTRAEDVPPGFRPLRWPHIVDVDAQTSTDDEPMIVAQGDLRITAEAIGSMELLATILDRGTGGGSPIAQQIAEMARFWQRHVRLIGGLAAALLVAVGLAVAPVGGQAAQAATESAAPVYKVVLSGPTATIRVPLVLNSTIGGLRHCGAVWGHTAYGVGLLGRACSYSHLVTVTARLDARYTPAGRSTIWLEDESQPGVLSPAVLVALRPSRIAGVYAMDAYDGQRMYVAAQVQHFNAAAGVWAPSKLSPLYVQVATRRGWRTRGTITTDAYGYAGGFVTTGPGMFKVRLVRPTGATVTGAVSVTQTVLIVPPAADIV